LDVLALIHQEDAPAGVFASAVRAAGGRIEEASYALGQPPRRPPADYDATLIFGGGMNVDQTDEHPWLDDERALLAELVGAGRPVLGVCLGAQLLAQAVGGTVEQLSGGPEIGWHELELVDGAARDPVIGALPSSFLGFEWHSYGIVHLPRGGVELARSAAGVQAYRLADRAIWGIQFHAEASRATLASWLDSYARDADARAAGIDRDELTAQNEREVERWNELGRRLCGAFLRACR
jgi:GMP synthase-like glutamine amidotransferase